MHARSASARLLALVLLAAATLTGCGKSLPSASEVRGAGVTTVAGASAGAGALAASGLATKNTTRLGGADAIADAAAVALTVDPGLTPATRPEAVALVDAHDWPAALAASALASAPLGAPLLYGEGDTLPALSGEALKALRPRGAPLLGGAQVIEIGTTAALAGYHTRALAAEPSVAGTPASSGATGGDATTGGGSGGVATSATAAANASAALAARVEGLVAIARGGAPRRVIVIGADGPRALAMPAAGLAAETGAPILPVDAAGIPPATRKVLARLRRPTIYVVGPQAAVSDAVLAKLARLGAVRRIDGGSGAAGGGEAVANAIAIARYSDGSFGWGIEEPGHGLVFANLSRPLDAPAAAPLSASGDYGPLLLLEAPGAVPHALAEYLGDIQPSYPEYEPTRGFYNHGWLIGGEAAIAAQTQAELDTMLESLPRASTTSTSTTTTTTP
ncbi:MAG TPA: cell wall-binding repeat-containing protein [Solirubrobacteraceae bacterium]|jgi:hypothetical protein|nr:cell wall-binding repeat-containing protein [Solirubrobacteraceae bacterium]